MPWGVPHSPVFDMGSVIVEEGLGPMRLLYSIGETSVHGSLSEWIQFPTSQAQGWCEIYCGSTGDILRPNRLPRSAEGSSRPPYQTLRSKPPSGNYGFTVLR